MMNGILIGRNETWKMSWFQQTRKLVISHSSLDVLTSWELCRGRCKLEYILKFSCGCFSERKGGSYWGRPDPLWGITLVLVENKAGGRQQRQKDQLGGHCNWLVGGNQGLNRKGRGKDLELSAPPGGLFPTVPLSCLTGGRELKNHLPLSTIPNQLYARVSRRSYF